MACHYFMEAEERSICCRIAMVNPPPLACFWRAVMCRVVAWLVCSYMFRTNLYRFTGSTSLLGNKHTRHYHIRLITPF
eukprot:975512-Amphidinium_carterae.1